MASALEGDGPGRRGKGLLSAVSSALLLLLAQPPFQFVLLPFVALVPLAVGVAGAGRGRYAAWQGLVFGLVYWGVLLLWVPLVVAPRFPWAYPGYLAQVGLLSGLTALMAWNVHALHSGSGSSGPGNSGPGISGLGNSGPGIPLALALPLAWVGMEWLKAHFPLGLSFPWLGLGMTLSAWPELLGWAEWTGEGGVAFWLALVNGVLASALLHAFPGAPPGPLRDPDRDATPPGSHGTRPPLTSLRLVSLAGLVAIVPILLGIHRARSLAMEPGPRVAVVGTGVPASLRMEPEAASRRALEEAEALLAGMRPASADLVVLPEALVGLPLDGPKAKVFRLRLEALARGIGTPLLVGALGMGGKEAGDLPSNSAFLLGPDGTLLARYDKSRLVPGMEWAGYRAGSPGGPIEAGDLTLGVLICYESIFGSLARRYGEDGATLLVNLTSDVWFGNPRRWPGKGFLVQHPAHLVMRAVETRVGVARAANGGFTLLLDPLGRALTKPLPPGPGLAVANVPVVAGRTLFTRTGDLVGPFSLVSALLLLLLPALRPGRVFPRRRNPGLPTG